MTIHIHKKTLKFHQLLHGYVEGHTLIAGSTTFSSDAERLIFMMSDMSGSSMISGFERYLSGYPLASEDAYALAMTWYAPEMKRPGCVFTHTIIIPFQELVYLQDMVELLCLFVKPRNFDDYDQYKSQLLFSPKYDIVLADNLSNEVLDLTKQTIISLYNSNYPVVTIGKSPSSVESIFLKIWSQQWPRLRSKFSFCTGSLSSRKLFDKFLDLQNVPQSYVSRLYRDMPEAVIVEAVGEVDSDKKWLDYVAHDVMYPDRKFRDFLWKYAAEDADVRSTYRFISALYFKICDVSLASKSRIEEALQLLRIYAPSVNKFRQLKKYLFSDHGFFSHSLSEKALLDLLVFNCNNRCLPPKALRIFSRASELYFTDKIAALDIAKKLLVANINNFQSEFIRGIYSSITSSDAVSFSNQFEGILPSLLKYNPKLLESPEIWAIPDGGVAEIFREARDLELLSEEAINAAIASGSSDPIADGLIQQAGEGAVFTALTWQNSTSQFLGHNWVQALTNHPDYVYAWFSMQSTVNTYSCAIMATVFHPQDNRVVMIGYSCWDKLANELSMLQDDQLKERCLAFLVALGFAQTSQAYSKILALTFQPYYDLLACGRVGFSEWGLVSNFLPHIEFKDWDRCERMRRGIVHKYIECRWPLQQFLETVKSDETFTLIVEYCENTKAGKSFIKSLRYGVKNHSLYSSKAQSAALNSHSSFFKTWI